MNKLTFKPFAIHYNRNHRKKDTAQDRSRPRGFTCWVSPSPVSGCIYIQVTFCAYKDNFNKKLGRQYAQESVIKQINARKLPQIVKELKEKVGAYWEFNEYNEYLWKYLL